MRCQGARWLRHMPRSNEPQSFFAAGRQKQLLGARLAPAARRSLGGGITLPGGRPVTGLAVRDQLERRRRALADASRSARLGRGPSYGPAGPRSIGGEPPLWCAVPAGPSRAWRSCSSSRPARGPSLMKVQRPRCSHAAHWSIQSTADVLEHAGGRPQWFLRSVSGDSAESRYAQALAGAWFCAGKSGCGTVVATAPWRPPPGACGAFAAAHRASPPLACSAPRGRVRLVPHSSGGLAGLALAMLGICCGRCHFAGAQIDHGHLLALHQSAACQHGSAPSA